MRFLLSVLITGGILPFYLQWSRAQAEERIDRMQEAAFNTPGAEAPVTPAVLAAGVGVIAGHFVLARLLRLRFWQALLSLPAGLAAGVGVYLAQTGRNDP